MNKMKFWLKGDPLYVSQVDKMRGDFIDQWEQHFMETVELFYLGNDVFNAALNLVAVDADPLTETLTLELQRLCYTIFTYDLLNFNATIEEADENS